MDYGGNFIMNVIEIDKSLIKPNPDQSREDFGDLDALRADISLRGLLNPITVKENDDGTYTLLAGERRLRAFPDERIPCHIRRISNSSDSAAENLIRKSLLSWERATEYKRLLDSGYSIEQIANVVDDSLVSANHEEKVKGGHNLGKRTKLSTKINDVKLHLRILELPIWFIDLIKRFPSELSLRHVEYIENSKLDEEDKRRLAELIIAEQLTTAELRKNIAYLKYIVTRASSLKSLKEYLKEQSGEDDEIKFIEVAGFVPDSCWYSPIKENNKLKNYIMDTYSKLKVIDNEGRGYEGSYTEFLPELAMRIIFLWSEENDVVIDPMAGRGTRGAISWGMRRHTYLCDCDYFFFGRLEKLKNEIELRRELDKNTSEFENFNTINSWINTACSRLDMNDSRIINADKIIPK